MTTDASRRYLIAYDIPDDKRRTKLAKRLQAYGDRIQFSVFVGDLKPARLVRLKAMIYETVERGEDSILICDLGPTSGVDATRFSFIGLERPVTPTTSIVL